jgi:LemA protein
MLTSQNIIWLLVALYVGIPLVWLIRVVRAFGRNQKEMQSSWSDLDVALLRKHDLILKVVETARPLVDADRSLASDVTHLRESAVASRWNVETHGKDERKLDAALDALLTAAKANLDGSDSRFLRDLQRELTASAKHIEVASRTYNVAANRYNSMLKTFPYSVVGKRLHLRPRPIYEVDSDAGAPVGSRIRTSKM